MEVSMTWSANPGVALFETGVVRGRSQSQGFALFERGRVADVVVVTRSPRSHLQRAQRVQQVKRRGHLEAIIY